ncbi:peptidoglycan-binding protein (plasmid) [Rhizobium leguminosarum]
MLGRDILAKAKEHLGETYILGARAPLQNANWRGPWDCAEYCSWLAYQTYGIVFGCGTSNIAKGDPYSGYWAAEASSSDRKITAEVAARTPGAFLIRKPVTSPVQRIGHVAIALGDGRVYEAAGAKIGVRIGPIEGRRWDLGVLLPSVEYTATQNDGLQAESGDIDKTLILRVQEEPVFDDHVAELQIALKDHGFDPGKVDGLFGNATEAAVFSFQLSEGLLPDGEVGPETGEALNLPYWQNSAQTPKALVNLAAGAAVDPLLTLPSDEFGAIVRNDTNFGALKAEYERLFATCQVQDRNNEIAGLCNRIRSSRSRYQELVQSFAGMPWYFVALVHSMEASGDVGTFKTHLHNGDSLLRPTVHVPKDRPDANGSNFTWEESARDALALEGYTNHTDWSLSRILYLLEKYNGMGPRKKKHATAYLWSYSNHYKRGKYIADGIWDDNAVSRQPGAGAILKKLVSEGTATL